MTEIIRRGVDYSTRPSSWAAFFDALVSRGYSVVGRYLSSEEKGATREELEQAYARGLSVFFYYETRTNAALDGYSLGVTHARSALSWLERLGIPQDLPVCYTVDFDASWSQLASPVRQYFEGVRSVVPVRQIGVYGGWRAVDYLMEVGLASFAVQTEAWSTVKDGDVSYKPGAVLTWHPATSARQWTTHGPGAIGGVVCDGLDIVKRIPTYHPQGGDDVTPEQDKLLRQGRLSDVARSYDVEIIRAEIRGDKERIAKLEADKLKDVAEVRSALGLDDD